VVVRVRAVDGDTLVFAHGHSLPALAARWLDQPVEEGRLFGLGTATTSVLGHYRETPVIETWNCP
jgi:probable phosphoglycerate mutase